MAYVKDKLSNNSDIAKATIIIDQSHPDWEKAYENWLLGRNPTDSTEWKKTVIMHLKEIK